jgi:hypothetical protein
MISNYRAFTSSEMITFLHLPYSFILLMADHLSNSTVSTLSATSTASSTIYRDMWVAYEAQAQFDDTYSTSEEEEDEQVSWPEVPERRRNPSQFTPSSRSSSEFGDF